MGGLVGVSEVLHPDERWLAVSTREPYLPFLIPAEDVNRSATNNDDGIVRATSRQNWMFATRSRTYGFGGTVASTVWRDSPAADGVGWCRQAVRCPLSAV